ncbi:hypothetical protein AB7M31_002421 [Pseudomonas sp. IAP-CY TE4608]
MKDKIIWLVCLLLFMAGFVGGKINGTSEFFTVASVHDLFDIIGVFATLAAALVALHGLNTWRKQSKATADHELARRLLLALRMYQEGLVRNWSYAQHSMTQIESNGWIESEGRENYLVGVYERRLKEAQEASIALEPLRIECSEFWSGRFEERLLDLYDLDSLFCSIIETSVSLLIRGGFDDQQDERSDRAKSLWESLSKEGLADMVSAKAHIENMVNPLKEEAKKRLLG